jgi:hypothetical protein
MKKNVCLLIMSVFFGLAGCASKHMQVAILDQSADTLPGNQSAIVFFRDTNFGGAIQAPIAEEQAGDIALVGILSANTRILHKTTPGKHFYVVGGEDSNLLETDLDSGKFYYVRVDPKMGMWKARFVFEPVPPDTASLPADLSGCQWVTTKPEAETWFLENKPSMKAKLDSAILKHQTADLIDKAIINPYQGTATLFK